MYCSRQFVLVKLRYMPTKLFSIATARHSLQPRIVYVFSSIHSGFFNSLTKINYYNKNNIA